MAEMSHNIRTQQTGTPCSLVASPRPNDELARANGCLLGHMLPRLPSTLLLVAPGRFPVTQATQLDGEMKKSRRSQRPRPTQVVSRALPRSSSQVTTRTDLPEVLEPSTLRRCDVECSEGPNLGAGTIVKLFPVSHQDTQSSGSPTRSVWIVQALETSNEVLPTDKSAKKTEANPRRAVKATTPRRSRTSVKARSSETVRQALVAKGARTRLAVGQQEMEGDTEAGDASNEEEEETDEGEDDGDERTSPSLGYDEDDEVIVCSTKERQPATFGSGECHTATEDCVDRESENVIDDDDDDDDSSHDESTQGHGMHEAANNVMSENNHSQRDDDGRESEERDCDRRDREGAETQVKGAEKPTEEDDGCRQDLEENIQGVAEGEKAEERGREVESRGEGNGEGKGEGEGEGEDNDTGNGNNEDEVGQEDGEEEINGGNPNEEEDEIAVGGMKKHENATRAVTEHHGTLNLCAQHTAEDHESNDVTFGGSETVELLENEVDDGNGDDNIDDDDDGAKEKQVEGGQANESGGGEQHQVEVLALEEERNRREKAVGQLEGERRSEHEEDRGGESDEIELGGRAQERVNMRENGPADKSAREGEAQDNESRKERSEDVVGVREAREIGKQGAAIADNGEAPRIRQEGVPDDEMEDRADTDSREREEGTGNDDANAEETKKRTFSKSETFGSSTPGDRPHKRSKSDTIEGEQGAATNDMSKGSASSPTTPGPRTPSLMSMNPSPSSTIEIVRQTNVVPGLEGAESAVWDAARRDPVISLLTLEQQTKMVHTALSLGRKEGIDALRDFVRNAREEGTRRRQALQPGLQTDTPHFGLDVWHAAKTMISRDSSLAQFSDLYRKIDILDNKVVLSSIAKRVQLAAMADYRKSLLKEGAGRNQAKDINLHLFHTVYPGHAIIRDPDAEGASSAARRDWNRLCSRLSEGRMWCEVRDLFGGVGAFLALPPQCVSGRHILRMQVTTFSSWLRLLEVAWLALDEQARHTLNDLVRMSLAGQPLPHGLLALETLEDDSGTAPTTLSDMLTGWSSFERKSRHDEGESSPMSRREKDGDRAALGPPLMTASTTNTSGKNDLGLCAREMPDVDDGLLNDIEFDDGLSQEI